MGRRELRVVHVIRNVGGEEPVVGTVLEQVPHWHRRVRESVHEDRLQQPFDVVHRVASCSDAGGGKVQRNKRKLNINTNTPISIHNFHLITVVMCSLIIICVLLKTTRGNSFSNRKA